MEGTEKQPEIAATQGMSQADVLIAMHAGPNCVQLSAGIGPEEMEGEAHKALRERLGGELGAALMQDAELQIIKDDDERPEIATLSLWVLTPKRMRELVASVYAEGVAKGKSHGVV